MPKTYTERRQARLSEFARKQGSPLVARILHSLLMEPAAWSKDEFGLLHTGAGVRLRYGLSTLPGLSISIEARGRDGRMAEWRPSEADGERLDEAMRMLAKDRRDLVELDLLARFDRLGRPVSRATASRAR